MSIRPTSVRLPAARTGAATAAAVAAALTARAANIRELLAGPATSWALWWLAATTDGEGLVFATRSRQYENKDVAV